MRVAILSDIHGNRHAFEAVLADVERRARRGVVPGRPRRLRRRSRRLRGAGRRALRPSASSATTTSPCAGTSRSTSSRAGAALAAEWTQEVIPPRRWSSCAASSPSGSTARLGLFHASPRDPVWEYVLSALPRRAVPRRPELPRLPDRPLARRALVPARGGRSRPPARPAAAGERGRSGRAASGCSTRAASASRATATRAPRGWCSTPRPGRPTGAATGYDVAGAQSAIRAARLPDSLAERLEYGQ